MANPNQADRIRTQMPERDLFRKFFELFASIGMVMVRVGRIFWAVFQRQLVLLLGLSLDLSLDSEFGL